MSKKPFGTAFIYVILGLLFIAVIGIRTISTPEIWTHLAQGRTNAPLSYLASDSAVNTTHLYDKLAFTLWEAGGPALLISLNTAALLGAFILLMMASKKWGGDLSRAFALLLCGHLIFQGLDVGPETLMMLFIGAFVYLLTNHTKPAVLFGVLIPLQIIWTNMHGSFLFGPFLAGLAAVQAAQAAKSARKKKPPVSVKVLGILSGSLLACTLLNPYVIKLHAQVFSNIGAPYPAYWSSLFKEYYQTPSHGPLIFLVFILGAGGLITLKKKLPAMFTTMAIVGAFLIVRTITSAQLFAVLAFPFLVLSLTAVGEYIIGSLKTLHGKETKILPPIAQGIFIVLLIISFIPVVSNCAYNKLALASSFGFGAEENLYPQGMEELLDHPAFPEKVINLAADGGYLAYQYDRKIFMDYRPGRYPREVLEDLNAMMLGDRAAYDKFYETYRPEAFIINTLNPAAAQGIVTLLGKQVWKLAYFDGTTALLLKNKEEFASLLNNTAMQAQGLAKLEAARKTYAEHVSKGCRAGNPAELIGSGKIFLALNRPQQAKAIFSLLLKGNTDIPGAWAGLGSSQLLLKDFDASMVSLRHALELTPNNIGTWISYAAACRYAGNTDEQQKAEAKIKQLAEDNRAAAEEAQKATEAESPATKETTATQSLKDITIPE